MAVQLATATQFRNELRSASVTALPVILTGASASHDSHPLFPNLLRRAGRNVQRFSLRRAVSMRSSLFWNVTQQDWQLLTNVSAQPNIQEQRRSRTCSSYPSKSPVRRSRMTHCANHGPEYSLLLCYPNFQALLEDAGGHALLQLR